MSDSEFISPDESSLHPDELAAVWAKRGIALLASGKPEDLEAALPCFDRAIHLREPLLAEQNPWFRYNLIGMWMNRGDALARLGGAANLTASLSAYDRALDLLQGLPVASEPVFARRLVLAWINRGLALLKQDTPTSSQEAAVCARRALELAGNLENSDSDAVAIGVKARQILCLSVAPLLAKENGETVRIAEAIEAAEDGLRLAQRQKPDPRFQDAIREFFRFGAQTYARRQPQFLAEFLRENLLLAQPESVPELRRIAAEAVGVAIGNVAREGFASLASLRMEGTLDLFRELREMATELR